MKIVSLEGTSVLDSNGRGAIEIELKLEGNIRSRAIAPRGSTTGKYEASFFEDANSVGLTSVSPAVKVANSFFYRHLAGREFDTLSSFDLALRELDSSPTFETLGGNVAIATSMAFARALALKALTFILRAIRCTAKTPASSYFQYY